jgi:Flp pilus assembly protein TadG
MLRRFLGDRSGNYAMMMAVLMIPLLLAVGLGVDYARYVSAHSHLQELSDAAALAVAASSERDDATLRALASDMIARNKSASRIDNVSVSALDIDDDKVDIGLEGSIPTAFMSLANIRTMDVKASARAVRAVAGTVEVALVLDNTASMNDYDKIGTLKIAAKGLVDKLFGNQGADVRIGLVPYADNINVGTSNRGASWLSIPADKVVQPQPRTCKNVEVKHTSCLRSEKYSCPYYVDGVLKDRQCSRCVEPGPTTTTTEEQCSGGGDPTYYTWKGCIGSRVDAKKALVLDDGSPAIPYPGALDANDNKSCLSEVLPLTTNANAVQNAIKGMTTSSPGYTANTYIPGGMIWGINMLSPLAPLTEGAAYDPGNNKPRKVIVLMTDGLNSRAVVRSGSNKGFYTNANEADQQKPINDDTLSVCNYAKSKAIEIFSIAFMVDDGPAKSMLQDCAADAEHYYDASDSTKLLAAFSGIAQSLTQVRLAR